MESESKYQTFFYVALAVFVGLTIFMILRRETILQPVLYGKTLTFKAADVKEFKVPAGYYVSAVTALNNTATTFSATPTITLKVASTKALASGVADYLSTALAFANFSTDVDATTTIGAGSYDKRTITAKIPQAYKNDVTIFYAITESAAPTTGVPSYSLQFELNAIGAKVDA